jgi:flagellar basal-body rod protein FlgG
MDRGLYIAASGMLTEQIRQQQIANDLANTATAGYKSDRTAQRAFGSLALVNTLTGQPVGSQSLGVAVDKVVTDFTPQPSRDTGEPLDFAISGQGFFAVQTANGTRYTRNGQFSESADGELVTPAGDKLLGRDGRTIQVGKDGTVDPRRLDVVLLTNPQKTGDNLVTGTPGPIAGVTAGQVRAGALEGSGADPARSMVDMIASLRAYEAGQKAIQAIDDVLGKASNNVGTLA